MKQMSFHFQKFPEVMQGGRLNWKLKFATPHVTFIREVKDSFVSQIFKRLNTNIFRKTIKRGVGNILEKYIKDTDAYKDMAEHDGRLRRELGVIASERAMNSFISHWKKTVDVQFFVPTVFPGGYHAGTIFSVTAIDATYEDVKEMRYASYTTEKGVDIPWLDWLLERGVEIMQAGWIPFRPFPPTKKSRTKTNTIMKKTGGKGWGIPEKYAGTSENNFVTRAVEKAGDEIEDFIVQTIHSKIPIS